AEKCLTSSPGPRFTLRVSICTRNARKPMLEHFEGWLELFTQTVDAHYQDPNASTMKQLAHSIARTIYARVSQQSSVPMGVQDAPSETSAGAG
ncbi:MAG: hypothetical protein RQ868_08405, partial [Meiothermus sp.]|nr:hypothetical protein [Meiothermus sp.]